MRSLRAGRDATQRIFTLLLIVVGVGTGSASAGEALLERIIVTAERLEVPLAASTAAVERITRDELIALPVWDVAKALEYVPGFALLQVDGLGNQPRFAVRGFYGGGETDYVTVLLDGVPLSGLSAGLVNWDVLPLIAVNRIEVIRGGASTLYGDAAVGGVVSLITTSPAQRGLDWSLAGGSYGLWRGAVSARGSLFERDVSVFAGARRSSGYREHADHRTGSLGASLTLDAGEAYSGRISTLHHWREYEEPGPLPAEDAASNRRASLPFYRFDGSTERLHRLAVDGAGRLGPGRQVRGYLAGEYADATRIRTLPLSPEFADTQQREWSAQRLIGSAQLEITELPLSGTHRLILGTDLSFGKLDSEYRHVLFGDVQAYGSASGSPGPLRARGDAERATLAGFAFWEWQPTERVRIPLGGRFDWLRDRFEPRAPSVGSARTRTHTAFSPKIGINANYLRLPRQSGSLYLTAGRLFKAPTLDQLFDQRTIPISFEPFTVRLSSDGLDPQHGDLLEAGLYHRIAFPGGALANVSLVLYQQEMRDEIDFDLQTLSYVNIGRSRHRGVEAGFDLTIPSGLRAFASFTHQSAQSRLGASDGRYLKAIPRQVAGAGVSVRHASGLEASLTASNIRGIYLDDANTLELPGFTRIDARVSYPLGELSVSIDATNLLDRQYSTTGFPDPAGSGLVYLHPAAGRVVVLGISLTR